MNISISELTAKLDELHLCHHVGEDHGFEALFIQNNDARQVAIQFDKDPHGDFIPNSFELYENLWEAEETKTDHTDLTLEKLVEIIKGILKYRGNWDIQGLISATEVHHILRERGFKTLIADTGGGTGTLFFSKGNHAPFLAGPVSHRLAGEAFFGNWDFSYDLDDRWLEEDRHMSAPTTISEEDDFREALTKMMETYNQMIATGTVPSYKTGEPLKVAQFTGDDFLENMPEPLR